MVEVKLKFLHVCEQALVTTDGKVSMINIFSEINTKGLPAIQPKFVIFTHITGNPGRYSQKIEIISPQNSLPIASVSGQSEINGPLGNNFIANFINLIFPVEGKYWIKVDVDNTILTNKDEHFILVKKIAD